MARWTLTDASSLDSWEMPISPNKMTSPHGPKNSTIFARPSGGPGITRVLQFRQAPFEWSFSGVIRTQQHYDAFVEWTAKTGRLWVDDHLGRRWEVRVNSMELDERKPTFVHPWRYDYTVKTTMYGQVEIP